MPRRRGLRCNPSSSSAEQLSRRASPERRCREKLKGASLPLIGCYRGHEGGEFDPPAAPKNPPLLSRSARCIDGYGKRSALCLLVKVNAPPVKIWRWPAVADVAPQGCGDYAPAEYDVTGWTALLDGDPSLSEMKNRFPSYAL